MKKLKMLSVLYDSSKKIKALFEAMRGFGVSGIVFIQDSVQEKIAIKINLSFVHSRHVDKIQQLIKLVLNKEITLFYYQQQVTGAEFLLDDRIEKDSYVEAQEFIKQWQNEEISIKKQEVIASNLNEIATHVGKSNKKEIHEEITLISERVQPTHSQPIDKIYQWKSATYAANDKNCTVYPLRGRGLPAGRYFITAQLDKKNKINPGSEAKILRIIKNGKVDKSTNIILCNSFFGALKCSAKVKLTGVGGINEPIGYCTRVERTKDNEVLYILNKISSKVH